MQSSGGRYNLFGREFKADPYPTYAALRAEHPIHRRVNASRQDATCFVTGYADAVTILRDHTHFVKDFRHTLTPTERASLPPEPRLIALLSRHMLNSDAPEHTRLRALVSNAFTVRMIEQMSNRIQEIAHGLLDRALKHAMSHSIDLIYDFALPLPIIVIAELLGIPTRDQNRFRAWSHAIVQPSPNAQRNAQKQAKARQLMEDFIAYLRHILNERRKKPGNDLITSLIKAEDAGDVLSEDEIFSTLLLLIVVGHETSVNLIGNSVLTLCKHPTIMQQLRHTPEMIPLALEELIRYDGPVERAPMRFAAQDIEINGQLIQRGDAVSVVLAAANRDPAQFESPDQLDIQRQNNRHLGFGLGVHYCLGAPLARLEGQIAISTLLERMPDLQLATTPDNLRWHTHPIMRGLHHLPVTCTSTTAQVFTSLPVDGTIGNCNM